MGELIRESYLSKLERYRDRPDVIKIVTGVRRSGKSTILRQFRRRLESSGEDVTYANMEELGYVVTTDRELFDHVRRSMGSRDGYVLLDEVQLIRGWERAVNTLRANGANVYVTGSNSGVLSSDLSTLIAGRYVEIHVMPLSFSEFVQRYPPHGDIGLSQRFDQYRTYGGIPMIDVEGGPEGIREILSDVGSSILLRDVATRSDISVGTVRRLTGFMYGNIGNRTSLETLKQGAGISDNRTLDRYLEAITGSYAFYRVEPYDLIGRRMLRTNAKFYASDVGLRNVATYHVDDNSSGILENIVFLELRRRGYDVVVGSYRHYEVDFTARRDGATELIQVSKTILDPDTEGRELRPLRLAGDAGDRKVITLDRDLPDRDDGVPRVNMIDWLLDSPDGRWSVGGRACGCIQPSRCPWTHRVRDGSRSAGRRRSSPSLAVQFEPHDRVTPCSDRATP